MNNLSHELHKLIMLIYVLIFASVGSTGPGLMLQTGPDSSSGAYQPARLSFLFGKKVLLLRKKEIILPLPLPKKPEDSGNQGGKRLGDETSSPLFKRCVMRRRTGTSALSALAVRLVAGKIYLSTNRKSRFLSLFFSQPCTMIKTFFHRPGS